MNIYRNLIDNKLYLVSEAYGKFTGKRIQYAEYDILSKQQSGPWKNLATSKQKFFIKVYS